MNVNMELTKEESAVIVSLFFIILSEKEIGEIINDEQVMKLSSALDCIAEGIKTEAERRKVAAAAFTKITNHVVTIDATEELKEEAQR